MRKFAISLCAALLWAGMARAENYETCHLNTTVLTNTATIQVSNIATSDAVFTGCLDYLWINLGGYASPTVTVSIATSNMGGWPSRTLFTKVITADAGFPVRQLVVNTSGTAGTDSYEDLPLFFDKLVLTAYSANVTNAITVNAYIYVSP
jgi:hypothetical protein